MPVRIWWHDGVAKHGFDAPTVILSEPEISTELVTTVSGSATDSAPAPAHARVAVLKLDADHFYRVRLNGIGLPADATAKVLTATDSHDYAAVDVRPGDTISLRPVV